MLPFTFLYSSCGRKRRASVRRRGQLAAELARVRASRAFSSFDELAPKRGRSSWREKLAKEVTYKKKKLSAGLAHLGREDVEEDGGRGDEELRFCRYLMNKADALKADWEVASGRNELSNAEDYLNQRVH